MESDRDRWDRRWDAAEHAPPSPPEALTGHEDLLHETGWVLDVACGLGGAAVWCAMRGLDVVALDVSPIALERAAALADAHQVGHRIDLVRVDLDEGLPPEADGAFDLVVCNRFRDPALYGPLAERLAPGGLLALTVLSVVDREDRTSPHAAAAGELLDAFGDLEVLRHDEGDGVASLLARRR
ncbi:MAG: class I SAM-dependent methyltransferase [Actinomycetota bacterium]|nr:class I SAM-dependent methyltransferase [Actinomycetota bacterium]